MELPQNLWQTFACVASEKKLPPKNGVATKFIANFCLCSIRKKTFSQKWSCHKIYCKCKIFLTCVYMIFKYSKRFCPSKSGFKIYKQRVKMARVRYAYIKLRSIHSSHTFNVAPFIICMGSTTFPRLFDIFLPCASHMMP